HVFSLFPYTTLFRSCFFEPYGVAERDAWISYVHHIFKEGAPFWQRSKQIENANLYESFVYEHALCYSHLKQPPDLKFAPGVVKADRKSTRLNSSHVK